MLKQSFPFTGTRESSPTPKNQPHTIILLHQTLQLAECSQAGNVLLASAKPRLVHQTFWQRSMIRQFRENVSTTSESSGDILYITPSDTWYCAQWYKACIQLLGHRNFVVILMPEDVWNSAVIESTGHWWLLLVLYRSVTQLYDFAWSAPSEAEFLCFLKASNFPNCVIYSRYVIDFIHMWQPYTQSQYAPTVVYA